MFNFSGPLLISKSWLNRALVIRHLNPQVSIHETSKSDDVQFLQKAIDAIGSKTEFDLGLGGTTFRFFAFLISRFKGDWILKAQPRLFERPQNEILDILKQLGVTAQIKENQMHIQSQGWLTGSLVCSAKSSSQFLSGLMLSSWNLAFDINLEVRKPINSFGYLKMTYDLLRRTGMKIEITESSESLFINIPKQQQAHSGPVQAELDISSAFSLIAAAAVAGRAEITNWNGLSLQPDLAFLTFFEQMKIDYQIQGSRFSISKHENWQALDCNLNDCPDLFPVLSVLCALADGVSTLSGAAQLKHKESDRIKKTQELLVAAGFKTNALHDGLRIYGQSSAQDKNIPIHFDPDHDHRMAMAAGVLKLNGYNIQIMNPEVVNKSYPDFWKDIGLIP